MQIQSILLMLIVKNIEMIKVFHNKYKYCLNKQKSFLYIDVKAVLVFNVAN